MELIYRIQTMEDEKKAFQEGTDKILYTWNQCRYYGKLSDEAWMIIEDRHIESLMKTINDKGHVLYTTKEALQKAEKIKPFWKECTHVLMNTSMIDEKWCYPILKSYIRPQDRVCVLALSFFDDTKNEQDWNRQYAKGQGIWYRSNTDVFFRYGIKESQIEWVNYFTDNKIDMENKILQSSIVLLTGGAPDYMMQRIKEHRLQSILKRYQGLMIGYSAGAMIQLDTYHITPDSDYPVFSYQQGLGCLHGFDIEVHYHRTKVQTQYIDYVLDDKKRPIYALYEKGGLVVHQNQITMFGQVDYFHK